MLSNDKRIIVDCIKIIEEILKENKENIKPELKLKAEKFIYKSYEELSKIISNSLYYEIDKDDFKLWTKLRKNGLYRIVHFCLCF